MLRSTDVDALSGRQPVDLDDARGTRDREPCSGGDARRGHNVLRKRLRALDRRSRATWPEHRDAEASQRIRDAEDERNLRPDDDELDVERAGEREERLGIVGADGMTRCVSRDARVSGRGMELGQLRRLGQLPGQRVLSTA